MLSGHAPGMKDFGWKACWSHVDELPWSEGG